MNIFFNTFFARIFLLIVSLLNFNIFIFSQTKPSKKNTLLTYNDSMTIVFEDPILDYEISKLTSQKKGSIKFEHIKKIENLELSKKGISKIGGLHYFVSLKTLNLSQNNISNLEPLSTLINLETIGLNQNPLQDKHQMTYFSKLKNLKKLYLGSMLVGDSIYILGKLLNLEELTSENAEIEDISAFKNLKNLKKIFLSNNKINNIEVVKNMPQLEVLTLKGNPITSIQAISKLTKLETLDLSKTNVNEINSILNNKQLQSLDISNTQVSEIIPLSALSMLNSLFIQNLQIPENTLKHLKAKLPNVYIFK